MKKLIITMSCAISLILAGGQSFGAQSPQAGFTQVYSQTAEDYLKQATNATPPTLQALQLQALGRALQDGDIVQAQAILTSLSSNPLTPAQTIEKNLLLANLYVQQNQPEHSLAALSQIQNVPTLPQNIQIAYYQLLSRTDTAMGNPIATAQDLMNLDPLLASDEQQQNRQAIWQSLQQAPVSDINAQLRYATNPMQQGWLDLAYIEKAYADNATTLNNELQNWSAHYPNHPALAIVNPHITPATTPAVATTTTNPNQVAVLIPESGALTYAGSAIRNGVMAAYYDEHSSDAAPLQFYNTNNANISAVYQQAVTDGAQWVLGPLDKPAVNTLATQSSLSVKTLTLNVTTTPTQNHDLYQYALSPLDEAAQAADKAAQDGYTHAIIIAPAGIWGQGVANAFAQQWQANHGTVVDKFFYNNQASLDPGIKRVLRLTAQQDPHAQPLHRQDVDMIFLVADPMTARQVKPLLGFYYANDLPVYATSMVYSGVPNANLDKDLDGIRFCDIPFVLEDNGEIQQAKVQMQQLMPNTAPQSIRLFAFGYDAYHLMTVLPQLGTDPANGYQGLTGNLYIDSNQQVKRQLPWAEFEGGTPKTL